MNRYIQRLAGSLILLAFIVVISPLAGTGPLPKKKQNTYATAKEAALALYDAVKANDKKALQMLFGQEASDILDSGDEVAASQRRKELAEHMSEGTRLEYESEAKAIVRIGKADWPLPIPLVRKGERWLFDTAAGKEQILSRRIGKNEIYTIETCRAYVAAQIDYYRKDWDGDGVAEFAQRLRSSEGKRDGLVWIEGGNEPGGPLAGLVTRAKAEGYFAEAVSQESPGHTSLRPFHGYYYRILKHQGGHAPAGKFDYVINGHMISGFALVAWPARWGSSGIMTFIINQDGKVYQKNLGKQTTELVRAITTFNPDDSWTPVKD